MFKPRISALLALGVLSAAAPATILYQTGFETGEGFSAGPLDSQADWFSDSDDITVSGASGGVNPSGGSQMVSYVSGTTAGEVFYSWTDLSTLWANRPANQNKLVVSIDIFIPEATENVFDIGLAIWGFDTAYSFLGEVDLSTDVDAVRLYDGFASVTETSTTFQRGVWNRLGFVADWDTGSLTASLNGVDVAEVGNFENTGAPLADVDLSIFSLDDSSANTVYFDNFSVESVPEPATMAALALGVAALTRRRKA